MYEWNEYVMVNFYTMNWRWMKQWYLTTEWDLPDSASFTETHNTRSKDYFAKKLARVALYGRTLCRCAIVIRFRCNPCFLWDFIQRDFCKLEKSWTNLTKAKPAYVSWEQIQNFVKHFVWSVKINSEQQVYGGSQMVWTICIQWKADISISCEIQLNCFCVHSKFKEIMGLNFEQRHWCFQRTMHLDSCFL